MCWAGTTHTGGAEAISLNDHCCGPGLVSFTRVEDVWVTSWPLATSAFSGVMSRNHFSLLMRFLYLNDSSQHTSCTYHRDDQDMMPFTEALPVSRPSSPQLQAGLHSGMRDIRGSVHEWIQRLSGLHTISPQLTNEVGDEGFCLGR